MLNKVKTYCDQLIHEFDSIVPERKIFLGKIADYINTKRSSGDVANLVFICTHNSRRSHFGQVWAQVGAWYFGIDGVQTFSGGTEATAFHPNAIVALRRAGLNVLKTTEGMNPIYNVVFDDSASPAKCFSKVYDHPDNPEKNFAAIMTCSDAEENCPFIPGVELRISTTYNDPKVSDGTDLQDATYDERCQQIAREVLFIFSLVKS
jgi:arsenate reductase (thioredoxin)